MLFTASYHPPSHIATSPHRHINHHTIAIDPSTNEYEGKPS